MISELGYSITAIISFVFVTAQASYLDIKERTVRKTSYIYLVLIAFINKNFSITASIFGAVIVFIIIYNRGIFTERFCKC